MIRTTLVALLSLSACAGPGSQEGFSIEGDPAQSDSFVGKAMDFEFKNFYGRDTPDGTIGYEDLTGIRDTTVITQTGPDRFNVELSGYEVAGERWAACPVDDRPAPPPLPGYPENGRREFRVIVLEVTHESLASGELEFVAVEDVEPDVYYEDGHSPKLSFFDTASKTEAGVEVTYSHPLVNDGKPRTTTVAPSYQDSAYFVFSMPWDVDGPLTDGAEPTNYSYRYTDCSAE